MNVTDWRAAAGLLALMGLPAIGPATALAVARSERDAAELPGASRLADLHNEAIERIGDLSERGVNVLGFFDDHFPSRLRDLPSPPAVIYVRGSLDAFSGPSIAVAGTRQPTGFGTTATQRLTLAAAERGIVIVSGLALGIDTLAHEAALNGGGRTIAVLGSGVETATPRQNADLADRIVGCGGALISEQPPGTTAAPRTLVARNRLQSILADGLLVGQTGVKGGTMHTVRFAAEQGRPVWCPVPHPANDRSAGLTVLLHTPACALGGVIPAWQGHERLAGRLGSTPLARAVTAEGTKAWLDELSAPQPIPAADAS
jgi:DNA processing protein